MWNKSMISLEQAQNAITAMIADWNRDPNRRKVDMAVVDDAGNLLAYARMDRCLQAHLRHPQGLHVCGAWHRHRRLRRAAQPAPAARLSPLAIRN